MLLSINSKIHVLCEPPPPATGKEHLPNNSVHNFPEGSKAAIAHRSLCPSSLRNLFLNFSSIVLLLTSDTRLLREH